MITPERQREMVVRVLQKLQQSGFYGKLVLQFTEGNVVMFRTEQTFLPETVLEGSSVVCAVQPPTQESTDGKR